MKTAVTRACVRTHRKVMSKERAATRSLAHATVATSVACSKRTGGRCREPPGDVTSHKSMASGVMIM